MKHIDATLLGMVLLVMLGLPTSGPAQQSFSEDFTTTVYMDVLNTTAHWDDKAEVLKLFPLPRHAGSCDTPDDAWGIAVAGDHAFVADGLSGLQVIDISDPVNPVLVGTCDTPGSARGIVVAGNHAFVADYGSGLQVVDISDPTDPVLAGAYDTSGYSYGLAVSGDHVFLADGGSGLLVIDISDPVLPTLAGSYVTPGSAFGVAVSGNRAFVAAYAAGLLVIDISDPTTPALMGTHATTSRSYCVAVSGNHAYVADNTNGLQAIDISDPANPVLDGACDTPGFARGVVVAGNHAYVADDASGLQLIDLSDPAKPVLAKSFDTPGTCRAVLVAGEHAFVADGGSGLQAITIARSSTPTFTGSYDTPDEAKDVAISGDHAFVADRNSGLLVIDISDPASPLLAGSCDTPGWGSGVAVSGDHAFLADYFYGLKVFDISDPATPTLVGEWGAPQFVNDVTVAGDYAYVGASDGFWVFGILNPANPWPVAHYATSSDVKQIALAGDYAYVAASDLLVLDVSDPGNPGLVGTFSHYHGPVQCVALAGDHALVGIDSRVIHMLDISDPTAITSVDYFYPPGQSVRVAVSGDFAFVADGGYGLQVLDISDPAHLTDAGTYNTPDSAQGVAVSGDHAFLGDRAAGLQVIQVFQGEVDEDDNVGQSLFVDASNDTILRARLTTTQADSVHWDLSADGGVNWQEVVPGESWSRFTVPGPELLWRSTHQWAVPHLNPSVSELEVEWLVKKPPINSIVDVPDDQGRSVNLSFTRSGYDFLDETRYPVVGYAIYRRLDDPVFAQRVRDLPAIASAEPWDSPQFASFDPGRIRRLEDRTFIVDGDKSAAGTLPPGIWEGVGWVLPTRSDTYTARVNTLADSTAAAMMWSVFVTAVHTSEPSIWYASEPDSGCSIDNIPPGVPSAITASYQSVGVALDWDDAPDADFQCFRVYRGSDPGFAPSADNLVHEGAVSAWNDPAADPWGYHYKITALDDAGNESEAGEPAAVSGARADELPAVTTLLGAVPNPFNPSTTLRFELVVAGRARLAVFDVAGRCVATVLDEHREAGRHEVIWAGRDDAGREMPSGVYFFRLDAGRFSGTKRMVLVK